MSNIRSKGNAGQLEVPDNTITTHIPDLTDDDGSLGGSQPSLEPWTPGELPATHFYYGTIRVRHSFKIFQALNEQQLIDIFMTTLTHHQLRLPSQILLFRLGEITFKKTVKLQLQASKRLCHLYRFILVPAPTEDQFDI
jgi:hypothetical protein